MSGYRKKIYGVHGNEFEARTPAEFYEAYWRIAENSGHKQDSKNSQAAIAEKMIPYSDETIKILDVGCGPGALGKLLRKNKKKGYIVGVDISKTALVKARRYYNKTKRIDLNTTELSSNLTQERFNYLVCLDVLEHLFLPENMLNEADSLLFEDGNLIISFPNFAFFRNRFELAQGKFPSGQFVHDAEHLRFWTFHSFEKMLKQYGFKIQDFDVIYDMPPGLKFLPSKVKWKLAKEFPNFFCIQIIALCKKA